MQFTWTNRAMCPKMACFYEVGEQCVIKWQVLQHFKTFGDWNIHFAFIA